MIVIKKHIIFDMDGTLSDTAVATYAAVRAAKEKHGLPEVTINDVHTAMGLAGLEFFRCMYSEVSDEKLINAGRDIDDVENEKIIEMGKNILFHGVTKMLEKLFENGYILYIASTGSEKHVKTVLQSTDIMKYFKSISYGRPEKISMVREIIADRNPDEFVMVGDMFKDSEAARGNNILALGAEYGYLAKDNHHLFDSILKKPMDIFDYL
ncbi:MAG: HAD family hydrolase [Oscillospiraceae bacterium]|nr:HAD family hydrolase [Oscillospiraceae bacterium]